MPPSPHTSKPPFNIYWKRICHQRFSFFFLHLLFMQFKHTQNVRGYFLWGDLNHKNFFSSKKKLFSLLLPSKINKKLNNKVLNSFYRFVPNQTCTFFVLFQLFFSLLFLNKCCCGKKRKKNTHLSYFEYIRFSFFCLP